MVIEVTFRAEIDNQDYHKVKQNFENNGEAVISERFADMKNVMGIRVEQVASKRNTGNIHERGTLRKGKLIVKNGVLVGATIDE